MEMIRKPTFNPDRERVSNVPGAPVEMVLRQFLHSIGHRPDRANRVTDDEPRQIILDTHLDGVRYTVTRIDATPAHSCTTLSQREQEIVRLVIKGYPNKSIAAILDISQWTVATHLKRIFSKLNVNSRAEMVARALQEDMLCLDD